MSELTGNSSSIEDDILYDAARYTLASLYVVIACISASLLWSLHRQNSWTWQRTFHIFVLLGLVGRAIFFYLQPSVRKDLVLMPNCINLAIYTTPSLLFFSAYSVLICFWAEMYSYSQPLQSNNRANPTGRKLVIAYFGFNGAMYFCFILLFALDIQSCLIYDDPNDPNYPVFSTKIQLAASGVNAAIYIILAACFAYFAIRFHRTLVIINGSSVLSRITRVDVLYKLIYVAGLLTFFFVLRFSIIVVQFVEDKLTEIWWFDPMYFVVCEMIPLLMMFFIFRASSGSTNSASSGLLNVTGDPATAPPPDEKQLLLPRTPSNYWGRSRTYSASNTSR